jgi:hypothetical protein
MGFQMVKMRINRAGILKVRLIKIFLNTVLMGCFLHVPVYAEIYKWRDAKGVMNYSDTPPPAGKEGAQKIKAATVTNEYPLTRSDAYKDDTPSPSADQKSGADKPSQTVQAEDAKAQQMAQDIEARIKAQNCAAARSNYRNYTVGGRMQTVNEMGEKEYLTDEQIREGQMRAQQDIDENCPVE